MGINRQIGKNYFKNNNRYNDNVSKTNTNNNTVSNRNFRNFSRAAQGGRLGRATLPPPFSLPFLFLIKYQYNDGSNKL